jgi:hypothetical protein
MTFIILKYIMNNNRAIKIPNKVMTGLIKKEALNKNHSLTKIFIPGRPARDIEAATANKPLSLSS